MGTKNGQAQTEYVVGVDVGTGSARAGVFEVSGRMLAMAEHPIQIFRPQPNYVEQSSEDIWDAVCRAVRGAVENCGTGAGARVVGISFDATCSLVVLDRQGEPVTVSPTGNASQNVIVWMDHRAEAQAAEINRTGHRVLDYVGGKVSPEQEIPKLKWLKTHLPATWARAGKFLDLADYLVYMASGNDPRSLCTVVCKWNYLGHEGEHGAWDKSFFQIIDLDDLFDNGRAGETFSSMGTRAGELTPEAAERMGLQTGTIVGVGIIDAHAGGIGSIGMASAEERSAPLQLDRTLCLIGGTSSCHMAVSPDARFIKGVWGPYYGAMVPGMWLTEGGQSATGALLDHVIANHAFAPQLRKDAQQQQTTVYDLLNQKIADMKTAAADPHLTWNLHVLPDFHGNRSPRADSNARGMISGLTLDSSLESLALIYYATIQALAYGTRHIIEALNRGGYNITRIHACGGGTKNPLWLQEHADITGCPIYVARDCETVLLGAAMLAAVAAGKYASIVDAVTQMSPVAKHLAPDTAARDFHERKYEVFKAMYDDQQRYEAVMARRETGD